MENEKNEIEGLTEKLIWQFLCEFYDRCCINGNVFYYNNTLSKYITVSMAFVIADGKNLYQYILKNGIPDDILLLLNKYLLEKG